MNIIMTKGGCERCKNKGKIKVKKIGQSGRKKLRICPDCQGIGKVKWNKRDAKRFACRMVAEMVDGVMDCGFPLEKIKGENVDKVYDALGDLLMEMYKRGGEMGGIRNAKKVSRR